VATRRILCAAFIRRWRRGRVTASGDNWACRFCVVLGASVAAAERSLGAAVIVVIRAAVPVPIRKRVTVLRVKELLRLTGPAVAAGRVDWAACIGWRRVTARGDNWTCRFCEVISASVSTAERSLGAAVIIVVGAAVPVPIRKGVTGLRVKKFLRCADSTVAARGIG
jgi:hypothetical protein